MVSYKDKTIFDFTYNYYHDLENVNTVNNSEVCEKLTHDIIKLLNESGLNQSDAIKTLKMTTLNVILECSQSAVEDIEKKQIEDFRNDLK